MKATLCYLWVFLVCVCDSLLFSGKSIFYTNRKCLLSPRSAVLIRPLIPHLLFSVSSSFFFLSSFICLPQSTRLVSKVSSPAWPLLSLSTTVLTPSRVGSPILSEGTLQKKEKERKEIPLFFFFFFCKCCFKPILYLLCLWLMWALVCIFNHFSCLILDCPHLLILSFYSTSSLLYVWGASSSN